MHFRRLHPDFGAEVIGFDLHTGAGAADIDALCAAYDEHQLLLFRADRAIAPERQVEICTWFGDCTVQGGKWGFMDNAEAVGRERLQFHSDNSYGAAPIEGISLHALELPRNGAATAYVSGAAAWAGLSSERQAQLAPMHVRHRLPTSIVPEWPDLAGDHPVRMIHPRTGKAVLYVTEHHAERIHELAPDASAAMLADLFAHLYAPARIYTHAWALYDLILWDNLAIQHARPAAANPADGKRLLQRVSYGGEPFAEILARAQARARETSP